MPDAPELKPCPFCDCGDIRLVRHPRAGRKEHSGEDVWTVGCYNCGSSVPGRYKDYGRGLVIDAWNRRADLPPTLSQALALPEIKALVEALKNPVRSDDGLYDYWQHDIDPLIAALEGKEQ